MKRPLPEALARRQVILTNALHQFQSRPCDGRVYRQLRHEIRKLRRHSPHHCNVSWFGDSLALVPRRTDVVIRTAYSWTDQTHVISGDLQDMVRVARANAPKGDGYIKTDIPFGLLVAVVGPKPGAKLP